MMVIERSKAIEHLRRSEQNELFRCSHDATSCITESLISRDFFKAIGVPPTRHRKFVIRTLWIRRTADGFVAQQFNVFVRSARYPWLLKETGVNGAGIFGAST